MNALARSSGRSLGASTLGTCLALSVAGCSLVLPYPSAQDERGLELRHDGLDQDVDGAIDCADTDCTPSCPEVCDNAIDDDLDGARNCTDPDCDGSLACPEENALCADGRDNDLDGRIDARDAACWPRSDATLTRCASVLRSSVVLAATDWLGGTLETDPFGTGEGPWMRVPPGGAGLTHVSMSTGALEGTHVSARLHFSRPLGPGGAPVSLPQFGVVLGVPSATRASAQAINVLSNGSLFIVGDSVETLARGDEPLMTSEQVSASVEIMVVSGRVQASLRIDGMPPVDVESALSDGWPEAPALQLQIVRADAAGVAIFVESASIERERLTRCGVTEPSFRIVDDGTSESANEALFSLVRGPDRELCAIVGIPERGGAVRAYSGVSSDDGRTFSLGETVFAPPWSQGIGGVIAVSWPPVRVAYDPVTSSYELAAIDAGSRGPWPLFTARSTDCLHWEPPARAIEDLTDAGSLVFGSATGPAGYSVEPGGHTLALITYQTGAQAARLVRWTSSWGDPGTWVEGPHDASVAAFLAPLSSVARTPARPTWLSGLGTELIAPLFSGSAPRVLTSGGWTEAPALALSPSGEAGSFDALSPALVAFIEDACTGDDAGRDDVWCGRVYYDGIYDDGRGSGWGHAVVRIASRAP